MDIAKLKSSINKIATRIEYVEKLNKHLAYPEIYIECYRNETKPMIFHYGLGMYCFGFERIDSKKGNYDIKLIAKTPCEHEDPDKIFYRVIEMEICNNLPDDVKSEINAAIKSYELLKSALYEYVSVLNFGISIYDPMFTITSAV